MCSGGSCWELSLDRLVAGPQAAINAASATQGSGGGSSENGGGNVGIAASSAGGGKGSGKGSGRGGGSTLSFQGWTLDMLQVWCCTHESSHEGVAAAFCLPKTATFACCPLLSVPPRPARAPLA